MLSKCASRQWMLRSYTRIRPRWKHAGMLPPIIPKSNQQASIEEGKYSLLPSIESLETSTPKSLQVSGLLVNKTKTPKRKASRRAKNKKRGTTPKKLLHEWYTRHYSGSKLPEYVDMIHQEPQGGGIKTWRTCAVTCPITKITMEAGTLREYKSDIKVIDGRQYYEIGKWAREAAAARMWDSILWTKSQQVEPRLCEEEPLLLTKELFSNKSVKESEEPLNKASSENSGYSTPLSRLNVEYQKLRVSGILTKGMTVQGTEHGYTATFTCPYTGHSVKSGTLKEASDNVQVVENVTFYENEKVAEHAAAARFLDDLGFSRTGEKEPRLCQEEPIDIHNLDKLTKRTFAADDGVSPIELLHRIYERLQSQASNENFVNKGMEAIQTNDGWTCTFSCPITGHIVTSGILNGRGSYQIVDGEAFYDDQKVSEHAAAARFLDDVSVSKSGETEPRLCEEKPSSFSIKLLTEPIKTPQRPSPSNELNNLYQKLGLNGIMRRGVTVEKTEHGFTATFTCPVTGHVVESGRLADNDGFQVVDDKAFYEQEKDAERAVAARFLDDWAFTRSGESESRLQRATNSEPAPANELQVGAQVLIHGGAYKNNHGTIDNVMKKKVNVTIDGKGSRQVFKQSVTVVPSEHSTMEGIGRTLKPDESTRTRETVSRRCLDLPSKIEGLEEKWVHAKRSDSVSSNVKSPSVTSSNDFPKEHLSHVYDKLQSGTFNRGVMKAGMSSELTSGGWSASFTCPLSGHSVKAGRWKEEKSYTVKDGVVLFEEGKQAEHAAAARFLDDLRFSRTGEIEDRLCEEVPVPIERLDKLHVEKSPLQQMDELYDVFGLKGDAKQNISTIHSEHGYTATYTCPMTGHVVVSGRLRDGNGFEVVDGVVFYKNNKDAVNAALARFLDDVAFPHTEARLCEESPMAVKDIGSLVYREAGPSRVIRDAYRMLSRSEWVEAIEYTRLSKNQWTAKFTCPITGYVTEAGSMKGSKDSHVVNGTVVYTKKRAAQMAASARLLDNLWYTQTGGTEPCWCEESPSLIQKEGVEKLFFDSERVKGYAETVNTWMRKHTNADRVVGPTALLMHVLKEVETSSETFESRRLDKHEWTSSFTCPVTGYVSHAGTLRGSRDAKAVDGKMVYRNEYGAVAAVAGRYLDDLRYTQTGETEPRWCEEAPSQIKETGIEKLFFDSEIEENYIKGTESRFREKPTDKHENDDKEELALVHVPSSTSKVSAVQDVEIEGSVLQGISQLEIESEDDEELVLQTVSSFSSPGSSTLDRIMEAWEDTVSIHKNLSEGSTETSVRSSILVTPARQKEKVIADTVSWYNRLRKQGDSVDKGYRVFQSATSPVTVTSATAALRALAKAHWAHPSSELETDQRVEAAAKQMIDLMWTTGSPSIDGYNSYLKCLGRSNAIETARAAENILRAMIERKEVDGRVLLHPNVGTFNTVIQLWALSGGDTGHSKCEEILDLLENRNETGLNVQPNRDSFLSVLSSLARPSVGNDASSFDRERAKGWIERMQQMGDKTGDSTLVADTQVFNAPLRWTGGAEAARTRPFAQVIDWDRHSDISDNGFRPLQEDDPLWIEARRIEEWLLEMETIGPTPDVETYEAAIQAWTRTGMADGLRRAELVALRALSSEQIRPRFQTFHPILASWAFSGDERGPEKIEEWAKRLEDGGRAVSELKPDERIHLAKMIALRSMQKRLLSAAENDAIDKASDLADVCAQELSQLIESATDDGAILDPSLFSHVVRAWGDVALAKAAAEPADSQATKAAVQSMMRTVKQFDDTVQHFLSKRSDEQKDHSPEESSESQLQQLLQYSQTVYLNALSVLNELDGQRRVPEDNVEDSSTFYKHFYASESMLRRAQELRLELNSSTKTGGGAASPDDITVLYNDLYTYPASASDKYFDRTYLEKQIALYSEVVDGCRRMKASDCFTDSVRLCMLVVGFMDHSASKRLSSRQEPVDCTDLYLAILDVLESIPVESDRHEVIRRVFHSVNVIADNEGDSSPFTLDKNAIMTAMKSDASAVGKKKGVRPRRRIKRQRWRSASNRA